MQRRGCQELAKARSSATGKEPSLDRGIQGRITILTVKFLSYRRLKQVRDQFFAHLADRS
jgi:hypothetical protein